MYMGQVFVGTSGFSYRDWVGPFYPEDVPREEFLRYYSSRFSFVELNFSYYRQPSDGMIEQMRRKVPEDFLFSIKAHNSMTHERGPQWQEECGTFRRGVEPLLENDQCAGVLLQFPFSFHYDRENRLYLAGLMKELKDLPLLVEFRNSEWEKEQVFDELRRRNAGLVLTDLPAIDKLPEAARTVTAGTSYIRFHGRNRENWWGGDNVSRYDYLYSREELEERLPDLQALMESSRRLFIAFNNHHKGQAVQNAFQLLELLEKDSAP
jgi:uncharacterized protein YecE (DUF72 family)